MVNCVAELASPTLLGSCAEVLPPSGYMLPGSYEQDHGNKRESEKKEKHLSYFFSHSHPPDSSTSASAFLKHKKWSSYL